jgi:hypothetical protein
VNEFELVWLKSGERSIKSRVHGETMHVGTGPRTEALTLHIQQSQLVARLSEKDPFVIWDVGLGAGANALTALTAIRGQDAPSVELHSFEISTDILEFALANSQALDYFTGWESTVETLLRRGSVEVGPGIRWILHHGDFRQLCANALAPSAIFFDPYSPVSNPAMWSLEVFCRMRELSHPQVPCLVTTYTRSTSIRAAMLLAGWFVGVGIPTGEKTETTIGANRVELLERPLDGRWLERARKSTNAAPIRGGVYARGPIAEEDFAVLRSHPQFTG